MECSHVKWDHNVKPKSCNPKGRQQLFFLGKIHSIKKRLSIIS
ncbi:hypothetical protein DBT_1117 [Dissulfuribacter thermophilus]|uniref:Uncharacterized protein n=1 Tax=Dissulfuribacter thermophilus TaxID=1156395 RepID=A0A1B9F635_9BACT|nr:hypothetical protein DBT_1117 [Dissulfuribacter thermophilus]